MTDLQFLSACKDYFGPYPEDKPGIRQAVSEYVKGASPDFLAALWPLVRDSRPQGWGPPDMACLTECSARAAEHARTHAPKRALLDDGPAGIEEVQQAMADMMAKLRAKIVSRSGGGRG